jgi:hypothetical protein
MAEPIKEIFEGKTEDTHPMVSDRDAIQRKEKRMAEPIKEIFEGKTEDTHPMVSDRDAMELAFEKKIDWDGLIKHLQIQKEAFKKMRIILLGYTREKDWVNIDGSPFLQESGAQAIGGPMSVNIVEIKSEKTWGEDKKGRFYTWKYWGRAYSLKIRREIEIEGICSSRDKFFGKVSGEYKELEEVDEPNVMRKALTNLYRNGVMRLLGLRNIEWSELSAANLNIQSIKKVEHTLGGKKTGTSEAAIQETLDKEKQGKTAGGYDGATIEKVDRLVKRIAAAPTMAKLQEIWEKDRGDRETLPKELFQKVMAEKDARKKWLIEKEEKEKKSGKDI